jgi:hypothetical protein
MNILNDPRILSMSKSRFLIVTMMKWFMVTTNSIRINQKSMQYNLDSSFKWIRQTISLLKREITPMFYVIR